MWTRPPNRFVIAVLALSLTVYPALYAGVAATTAPPPSPAQLGDPSIDQQRVDTDSVRLIVSVDENGSATWTVRYWTRLDDANTTDAFESLRDDVEADPSNFSDRFASRMRSTVRTAENATGRDMAAADVTVRAERQTPPDYGVVAYSFRWDGFAAVDGEAIRVGDAIEGLFLDDRTRLVIEWPETYAVADVAPTPDERRADAAVWRGATTSFVAGEPSLVLRPASTAPTTAGGADGPDATATPTSDGASGVVGPLLGVGILAVVGVAAWRYRDRFGGGPGPGTTGEASTAGAASADAAAPDAREDLLSNEERVLRFVREQGGRVKQQEIVEAFDWTEARTSQIVRDLRDDGSLDGFRLGRENVLKLPDEE
jgi:hypothetical protein